VCPLLARFPNLAGAEYPSNSKILHISTASEKPCPSIQTRNAKIKIFSKIRKTPINLYRNWIYSEFKKVAMV